jgi:hypothetical protein
MSFEEVERGLEAAWARMLAAWETLPEVDEPAERWFGWETYERYEEHLADLPTGCVAVDALMIPRVLS